MMVDLLGWDVHDIAHSLCDWLIIMGLELGPKKHHRREWKRGSEAAPHRLRKESRERATNRLARTTNHHSYSEHPYSSDNDPPWLQ